MLFHGIEFDPASGELLRAGERRRLEPQPAKVLALLAARAGEVVTHEELRRHVWGEATHVDFERGLRYCIAEVRSALGDSAQEPRFIETLPRRGYRFLVQPSGPGAEPEEAGPAAPRFRPRLAPVAGLLVLAALVAALLMFGRSAPPRVGLGVAPFDNETGDPSLSALARGLSDGVVARLAAIDRLAVVGNAPILFEPRESRDFAAIGRELGVSHVVFGQVQTDQGRIRVIVHLVRTNDRKHLWADRIESPTADLFALEEAVGRRVVAAVRAQLLD